MRADTVQVVWHGKEPVYSVDFHPDGTLATAGGDREIRLWKVLTSSEGSPGVKHLSTLTNHTRSVNAIRFSPSGDLLASAGDAGELLLWQPRGDGGSGALDTAFGAEEGEEEALWKYSATLRGHSCDVYDLAWAPDATALLSGSVENTALLWDVRAAKGKASLQDHKHFIQGVAWDPLGEMVVTQGADRTCRVYGPRPTAIGKKAAAAAAQPAVARVSDLSCQAVMSKIKVASAGGAEGGDKQSFDHLFRDENSGFYKRLSWSPDGSFLAVPAGRLRATMGEQFTDGAFLFKRGEWSAPAALLPFPGEATMAVRFCPVLFKLASADEAVTSPAIELPYRMVFAVASASSVALYSTQDNAPLAFLGMLHYAAITDLAWSPDGLALVCSSQDGYCSIAQFEPGELGEPLEAGLLPAHLRPARAREAEEANAGAAAAAEMEAGETGAEATVGQREDAAETVAAIKPSSEPTAARRIVPEAVQPRSQPAKTPKRITPEAMQPGSEPAKATMRITPEAMNACKAPGDGVSPAGAGGDVAAAVPSKKRIAPEAMMPCKTAGDGASHAASASGVETESAPPKKGIAALARSTGNAAAAAANDAAQAQLTGSPATEPGSDAAKPKSAAAVKRITPERVAPAKGIAALASSTGNAAAAAANDAAQAQLTSSPAAEPGSDAAKLKSIAAVKRITPEPVAPAKGIAALACSMGKSAVSQSKLDVPTAAAPDKRRRIAPLPV